MAVLTKNLPDTRRIPTFPVMQFTLERYHEWIKLGALGPSDKLELIDGWLVPKMPQNTAHATSLAMLQKALMKRLTDDWDLRTESPITLSGDNEPEPDIAVVLAPLDDYIESHPTKKDIGLLVEIADTSLRHDQITKLRLYAANHIPVFWIVNLVDRRVEVYSLPRAGRSPTYRSRTDYQPGESIPIVLGSKQIGTIPVDRTLPRSEASG